jgi:hypothetical protein
MFWSEMGLRALLIFETHEISFIETPNLDRLAGEGFSFRRNYCALTSSFVDVLRILFLLCPANFRDPLEERQDCSMSPMVLMSLGALYSVSI